MVLQPGEPKMTLSFYQRGTKTFDLFIVFSTEKIWQRKKFNGIKRKESNMP